MQTCSYVDEFRCLSTIVIRKDLGDSYFYTVDSPTNVNLIFQYNSLVVFAKVRRTRQKFAS